MSELIISEDLTQPRASRSLLPRFPLEIQRGAGERGGVFFGSSYNDVTAHSRVHTPVVQKVDRAIQRLNYYPVDSAIGFGTTYPLDSELSGEKHYPMFEQPRPSLTEPRSSTQGPGWFAL